MNNRTLLIVLFILLGFYTAFSQGTFTAISNNSWTNTLSWSHTGVDGDNIPDADDIVTIPNLRTITMPAGTQQVASLTIQSGGTLNMNTSGAILEIFPSGGLLQVDLGGTIQDSNTLTEINFLNTGSFIVNGIVQADFLQFKGTGQTVTITGGGTLLVGRINVSAINITITLNTTGSFGSNVSPLTIGNANSTIAGTGTLDIGGGQNLNISASGASIGCRINTADLTIISASSSLTITSGGMIVAGDDLRIGPNADASNSTVTVNNGGTLTISSDVLFDETSTGTRANNITISNAGTVSVTGLVNINSATTAAITNSNSFTIGGSINNAPVANPTSITNNANATFNIGGNIDTDATLSFTATGNTVNYNGAGAQNISTTTYYNLTLSNASAKSALGSFAVRGNWTRSGTATFTPGANTVTFSALAGSAAQTITAVGGETFTNLTINSLFATSPQITTSSAVTVTGTLTMTSGIVDLSGTTFTLGSSGAASTLVRTASTTTNWMYGGSFRRFWPTAQTPSPSAGNLYGLFPLGHSTASSYRPVAITAGSNITTTGSVTFSHVNSSSVTDLSPVYDDDPTAGVINIVRKHNSQFIGSTSGIVGGTNYTISVTMTNLDAGTASDIRLAVSNGATTVTNVGSHVANSGTAPSPVVGRSGLTVANLTNDFRITTINSTNTPLPIELIDFKAKQVDAQIVLNWSTASELNNDFFTIERLNSKDEFDRVSTVPGKGTTAVTTYYEAIDPSPLVGINYYRLKQTDLDGKISYSKIAMADFKEIGESVSVYPNPTNHEVLTIEVKRLEPGQQVPLLIRSTLGVQAFSTILDADSDGNIKARVLIDKWPQGLYLIQIGKDSGIQRKIVIE